MKVPGFLRKYFWDVDFAEFEVKDSVFIIERILEYGDKLAVQWMLDNFSRVEIKKVLSEKRGFSKKSCNYWSLFFNLPKNKILCLNKSYRETQKSHWPY